MKRQWLLALISTLLVVLIVGGTAQAIDGGPVQPYSSTRSATR